jgi:hypothetical protein
MAQAGMPTAAVAAKDKLRDALANGLPTGPMGIAIPAQNANAAQAQTHGIDDLPGLAGRRELDQYSADLGLQFIRDVQRHSPFDAVGSGMLDPQPTACRMVMPRITFSAHDINVAASMKSFLPFIGGSYRSYGSNEWSGLLRLRDYLRIRHPPEVAAKHCILS